MFVPGMCAGALLTLITLAFIVSSATSERPRRAESQTFTVVFYPTATSSSQAIRVSLPMPATQSLQQTATSTPVIPVRQRVERVNPGESVAFSQTDVLTTTLLNYIPNEEICPIRPGTCPYSYLVGNLDPGIVFPSEGASLSAPNRLMHPAMIKPLSSLSAAINRKWSGQYSLVVLSSYEPHEESSREISRAELNLSKQGQLAIITISPKPEENDDLAQFCGMAFQAGFDWVSNNGDSCLVVVKAMRLCLVCQSGRSIQLPTLSPTSMNLPISTALTPTVSPTSTKMLEKPLSPPRSGVGDDQSAPFSPTPIP